MVNSVSKQMLRYFSLFVLWLFYACQAFASCPLYNAEGGPSNALIDVLNAFDICHDGSWETIIQQTQARWLKGPNQERWEFAVRPDENPRKTYALFSNLLMTQSIWSQHCEYEYGIVLGSSVQVMRQCFWFLKQAWDEGVRFKQLVVLAGDRPLAADLENEAILTDPSYSPFPFRADWKPPATIPKNEIEAAKLIFDQLALPKEWRSMPLLFVDTPRPPNARRPNTSQTFVYWLQTAHPSPGSCLIISRQPFVGRQDAVAHNYLPSCFSTETIGQGFSLDDYLKEPRGLAILLDELARWIYEAVDVGTKASDFSRPPCLKER